MPTNANGYTLLIVTITKAVVCLILVATVCYCQVMGIPVEGTMVNLIWAILGVYFGISTLGYVQHMRNGRKQIEEIWRELERLGQRARE